MEWVETTGRTVEEAKDAALDQLGVDETDAEFVVLSEPRPGLFGRMRGEARVRARVMPTSPRPKRGRTRRSGNEQRRAARPSRSGDGKRAAAGAGGAVAVADAALAVETDETTPGAPKGNGNAPSGGAGVTAGGASRNRRRRGSRGGGGGGGSRAGSSGQGGRSSEGSRDRVKTVNEEGNTDMSLSLEEQGDSAREFVEGLLQEMGLQAAVSVRTLDESTAEVAVYGPELGILVGPGGATLGALQELTRTVVQKRTDGRSERILVDVAGYRARRAEALQRFTRQVAEEVRSSGSERALEPMSAADRKVVHDTVNELPGVETRSEGEDPRRYIVISLSAGASGSDDD